MEIRQSVEKLVMEIDLRPAVQAAARPCTREHVEQAPAVDIFENQADTVKRAKINWKVGMSRDRGVHTELRKELGCDVGGVGLHLAVNLELDDIRLLDNAFEELGGGPRRDGCKAGRGVLWGKERERRGGGGRGESRMSEDGGWVRGWCKVGRGDVNRRAFDGRPGSCRWLATIVDINHCDQNSRSALKMLEDESYLHHQLCLLVRVRR